MIVVRAPFRLPIGGGGTDLPSFYEKHGGYLLTAAINKYMYININTPSCINHISLKYSRTETVSSVHEIQHDLAREVFRFLDFNGAIEVSSMADASAGTGLGSSGAYTVGLLKGMNALLNRSIDKQTLASEACHIEMDRAKSPVGKQDQYASAIGGIFSMDISTDGEVTVKQLNLGHEVITELQYRLLMFYTDMRRSANDVLHEQSMKMRNDESKMVAAMLEIKRIGVKIEHALSTGDVDSFGMLMHEHWKIKKSMTSKMSNSQIDSWYELAMNNGALGGKIMGAGGGGFFVFCCAAGERLKLARTMEKAGLRYMDFAFDFEGARVMAHM